jgi:hypothetical protein
VYAEDDIMNEKMAACGKKLNIKGHYVGLKENTKFIFGPTGTLSATVY